jgi:hypothetical protein
MARIVCLAWLVLSLCVHASTTVGWRIPIETLAPGYAESPQIHRLDSPPGESAFFETGDELWDVSKPVLQWLGTSIDALEDPDQKQWSGEWMVWNARSRMLIVRGSEADIAMIEMGLNPLHPPELLRTKIDFATAPAAGSSISVLSRSGEEASIEWDGANLKLAAISSGPRGILDVNVSLSWPADDKDSRWNLLTALTVLDGRPCRLAAQGSGDKRQELFITVSRELGPGIPAAQFRWKEEASGVSPWPEPSPEGFSRLNLDGDVQIGIYRVPVDFVAKLAGGEGKELPKMQAPAVRGLSLRFELTDVRSPLEENGIRLKGPQAFAGFHPASGRVVLITDAANHDLFDGMVNGSTGCLFPDIWCETDADSGGWGLVCRPGEESRLWKSVPGAQGPQCEIAVTNAGLGYDYDATYAFDLAAEAGNRVASAGAFTRGVPQVVGARTLSGGGEKKITLTLRDNER